MIKGKHDDYMLCCDCGYFYKLEDMYIKRYKHTGIGLCVKCANKLHEELGDFLKERQGRKNE